jgi:hypothetical protein
MSYVYSKNLCEQSLRYLGGSDDYKDRLLKAFSEMGVANHGDTSDEIWKEWENLHSRYNHISGELYQLKSDRFPDNEMQSKYEKLGEELVSIICDWLEFNHDQISKGIRSRRNQQQ